MKYTNNNMESALCNIYSLFEAYQKHHSFTELTSSFVWLVNKTRTCAVSMKCSKYRWQLWYLSAARPAVWKCTVKVCEVIMKQWKELPVIKFGICTPKQILDCPNRKTMQLSGKELEEKAKVKFIQNLARKREEGQGFAILWECSGDSH